MIRKRIFSIILFTIFLGVMSPTDVVAQRMKNNIETHSEDENIFLNGIEFKRLSNEEFVDMIAQRKGISFFSALDYVEDKLGRKLNLEDSHSDFQSNIFTLEHLSDTHRFVSLGEIIKILSVPSSDGKFVKKLCISIPIEFQAQYGSTEILDSNGNTKIITDTWNSGTYSISKVMDDSLDVIALDKNLSSISDKLITVKQFTPMSIQVRGTLGFSSYNAQHINSVGKISFTQKLSSPTAPGFKNVWDVVKNLFSKILQ